MIKLGYCSRAGPRDNTNHIILGTQVWEWAGGWSEGTRHVRPRALQQGRAARQNKQHHSGHSGVEIVGASGRCDGLMDVTNLVYYPAS